MNFEIKRDDWGKFFESLNKRRFEWKTEIEVISTDMGDQSLNVALPLNGFTLETIGDRTTIAVSVGENTEYHQTHNIENPSRVAFLPGDNGHCDVLDIEEPDGTKTLIRFTEPMEVIAGFADKK